MGSSGLNRKLTGVILSLGLATAATLALLIDFSRMVLVADGKTYVRYSLKKGTVKDLVDLFHVNVSSSDILRPGIDERLHWGERVRVVRVSEKSEEKEEVVDFVLDWKRKTSQNLRKVEIQRGHREKTIWDVKKVLHDGQVASSKKTVKKIVKSSVERLVFLDSKGFPEKIYDLSAAQKTRVIATAYWAGDPQVPGVITFSGHKVERGLVAVDPSVIPLGHRLYIPGYGYAYSSDTGSAIKGNRIDLFVENKKASLPWEYRKVTVYILEKSNTW